MELSYRQDFQQDEQSDWFDKEECREFRDVSTLRTLYCALVRSQLEYGSVVWSPVTATNITKLERVQRRATKFILKTEDDYEVRISKLNLLSLEHRRFLFDLLFFFYKALNGYINIDMSRYVRFYSDTARYPLREKDKLTLKKNYARTNTFKFSFFNRIVDMWNSLPFHLRSASTRENEGTEREAQGVGRDMSCPRKLFLDERKSLF